MVFCIHDERWNNLRDFYTDEYGKDILTFVFGIIISLVCPFLFCVQNILLGLCISNGGINLDNFKRILTTTKTQIIVIYDMSMFGTKNEGSSRNILDFVKLPVGY